MPKIEEIEYVTEVAGIVTETKIGKVYRCDSPADLAALFDLIIFGEGAE